MNFPTAIYEHMASDGAIMALVEGRIYHNASDAIDEAEQRKPTITFIQLSESDESPQMVPAGMWKTQWRIFCSSENGPSATQIGDAVRSRFHGFRGATAENYSLAAKQVNRSDDFEPQLQLRVAVIDIEVQFRQQP